MHTALKLHQQVADVVIPQRRIVGGEPKRAAGRADTVSGERNEHRIARNGPVGVIRQLCLDGLERCRVVEKRRGVRLRPAAPEHALREEVRGVGHAALQRGASHRRIVFVDTDEEAVARARVGRPERARLVDEEVARLVVVHRVAVEVGLQDARLVVAVRRHLERGRSVAGREEVGAAGEREGVRTGRHLPILVCDDVERARLRRRADPLLGIGAVERDGQLVAADIHRAAGDARVAVEVGFRLHELVVAGIDDVLRARILRIVRGVDAEGCEIAGRHLVRNVAVVDGVVAVRRVNIDITRATSLVVHDSGVVCVARVDAARVACAAAGDFVSADGAVVERAVRRAGAAGVASGDVVVVDEAVVARGLRHTRAVGVVAVPVERVARHAATVEVAAPDARAVVIRERAAGDREAGQDRVALVASVIDERRRAAFAVRVDDGVGERTRRDHVHGLAVRVDRAVFTLGDIDRLARERGVEGRLDGGLRLGLARAGVGIVAGRGVHVECRGPELDGQDTVCSDVAPCVAALREGARLAILLDGRNWTFTAKGELGILSGGDNRRQRRDRTVARDMDGNHISRHRLAVVCALARREAGRSRAQAPVSVVGVNELRIGRVVGIVRRVAPDDGIGCRGGRVDAAAGHRRVADHGAVIQRGMVGTTALRA